MSRVRRAHAPRRWLLDVRGLWAVGLWRWAAIMPRLTHERPGMTYACPACDTGGVIYEKANPNSNACKHPGRPYRCESCKTSLTYIIQRPKKNGGGSRNASQKTLGYENGPRQRTDRKLAAVKPEDVGLSPIGVRGGAD